MGNGIFFKFVTIQKRKGSLDIESPNLWRISDNFRIKWNPYHFGKAFHFLPFYQENPLSGKNTYFNFGQLHSDTDDADAFGDSDDIIQVS